MKHGIEEGGLPIGSKHIQHCLAIERRANRSGEYISPIGLLATSLGQNFKDIKGVLQYSGSFGELVTELSNALQNPHSIDARQMVAFHPPRIIRGVIDWKIDHPHASHDTLVADAIELGLAVYKRDPQTREKLLQFQEAVATAAPELVAEQVVQRDDFATWIGTDPAISQQRARELALRLAGEDILLIALAHGGTAAGMDVFLRYVDITQSANSTFYVVRCSRKKRGDNEPQLSDGEVDMLRRIAQGRQVVLFEEDTVSGTTLNSANQAFERQIVPGSSVMTLTNVKMGGQTDKKLIADNIISKILSVENQNNKNLDRFDRYYSFPNSSRRNY